MVNDTGVSIWGYLILDFGLYMLCFKMVAILDFRAWQTV